VLYDAGLIREAATTGLVNYTQHALTIIVLVGWMFYNDPWLATIVLVAAPLTGSSCDGSQSGRARPPMARWLKRRTYPAP
jgi:hypothetical protein